MIAILAGAAAGLGLMAHIESPSTAVAQVGYQNECYDTCDAEAEEEEEQCQGLSGLDYEWCMDDVSFNHYYCTIGCDSCAGRWRVSGTDRFGNYISVRRSGSVSKP